MVQGPRLPVTIALPVAVAKLTGTNPTKQVEALIDTGARTSVITPKVVEHLGLQAVDSIELHHVGGIQPNVGLYVCSIGFKNLKLIESVRVIGASLPGRSLAIDCLIGRDILSQWLFDYDGRSGSWFADDTASISNYIEPEDSDLWGQ
jgi:predicted aspartyl protease